MPIQFKCPSCGKKVQTPDDAAGKKAQCPHCAAILKVPSGRPAAGAASQTPSQARAPGKAGPSAKAGAPQIEFACPTCGQAVRTPAGAAGKQAKCPVCTTVVTVPGGSPPAGSSSQPLPVRAATPVVQPVEDVFAGRPTVHPVSPQRAIRPQPARRQSVVQPANPYPANPYATSGGAPAAPRRGSTASSMVKPPAICMLVLILIWLGLSIVGLIADLVGMGGGAGLDAAAGVAIAAAIFAYVIFFSVYGLMIYGCISMMNLRNRGLAMTAMILALIPCFCSPGIILGIPVGIWGLIVLSNPTVVRAFR